MAVEKPVSSSDYVYQEQILLLFKVLPTSLVGTLLGIFFVLLTLWPVMPHEHLYIWSGVFILITSLRTLHAFKVLKTPVTDLNLRGHSHLFAVGAILAAAMWGAVGVFLFPVGDPVRQIMLAFIIATTAAFAMTNIASQRYIAFIFLTIIMVPLNIQFFMAAHETMTPMGIMYFFAFLLFLAGVYRSNKVIIDNIKSTQNAIDSEERLRQSQQKLALHVQQTPLAVIEWSPELLVLDWNKAAEKIFGFSREEALGKSAYELIVPEQVAEHVESINTHLKNQAGGEFSINENMTKEGSKILCEWFNTPLIDENNKVISIVSLAHDVSERVRLDQLKNEFVSTVSHELRTPLTSLIGSISLIEGGTAGVLPDKATELLQIALNNANRLELLINDILDIQRIESGQFEYHFADVSLNDITTQSIEENASFSVQKNINIEFKQPDSDIIIHADSMRIRQVFDNLLSNAFKFSSKNSTIEIVIQTRNNIARVSVRDYGIGIADDFQDRLFDQFTQYDSSTARGFSGTGLGLSIARSIIAQHNGIIAYEKPDGSGSCFFFELPIVNPETSDNDQK